MKNKKILVVSLLVGILFCTIGDIGAGSYTEAALDHHPSRIPDRIVLTWKENPAASQAVTWRTDSSVKMAFAEIAVADPSPDFVKRAKRLQAKTVPFETEYAFVHIHSVNFRNLQPNTLYAYRVGDGRIWSEWFHFRTASDKAEPFTFIYFGDAQKAILSLWSRAIRSAYSDAPEARFLLYAGDLVDHGNSDVEWGEWFQAGGWIHAMVPSIPTPGNHEYKGDKKKERGLSRHWRPQFTLPENGIEGLEETVYYIDYQGVRLISLNSNEKLKEQTPWLEKVLQDNPNRWTVITFHYPIFSSAKGRDNKRLRQLWKPLLDKYKVDLILQGHDHNYARGRNLSSGVNVQDNGAGTVYVVSVSGPKMYDLDQNPWMEKSGENTQLYQVISINQDTLHYEAVTVTGELYDAFYLIKQKGSANRLVEGTPTNSQERTYFPTFGKR